MAESGYPGSPAVVRGAFVQLVEQVGITTPNIIPFQYNPAGFTRDLTPWNPFEGGQADRGASSPLAQPHDPEESYRFSLELDATDDLEDGDPVAITSGVAARIAALETLSRPTQGPVGDLVATAGRIGGAIDRRATRREVPVVLFVMGPGTILPIRVTSMSIEVTELSPTLYPHMAEVTLGLRVLTPEAFQCCHSKARDLAAAAYEMTRLQRDALAVTHAATALSSARSVLPF